MDIFVNKNYDFIKWRFTGVIFSLAIIVAGAIGYFVKGPVIGIDFSGGANIVLRFQDKVPIKELRDLAPDATIQQYGKSEENSVLIRLPKLEEEADYAGQVVANLNKEFNGDLGDKMDLNLQGAGAIADVLSSADPEAKGASAETTAYYESVARKIIDVRSERGIFHSMDEVKATDGLTPGSYELLSQKAALGKFNVLNQETVGPQVGKDLQKKAVIAIILSVIAMGIYVGVRFDLKFGVAALICLAHDVAIALSFLILAGGEFSLNTVASCLLIVGYSINDTVVVYDRVRENAKSVRSKESFGDLLNRSINQTLSRTILTSVMVMIILVCLIIFGGEVINQFAWLMLIGTICGTYSTMTVVPAIVLAWNKYLAKKAGLYGGSAAPARNGG